MFCDKRLVLFNQLKDKTNDLNAFEHVGHEYGFSSYVHIETQIKQNWPQGYKTFSILNSGEHEIYPAPKC